MTSVPSSVVATDGVPPEERFPLWREALAPTHELSLHGDCDPNRFSAAARGWHLGNVLLLESRSAPQRLLRSSHAIRTDQIDHYIVRVQKTGSWTGDLGRHTVTADPGGVMVLDMARVSDARTTNIENVNLLVPPYVVRQSAELALAVEPCADQSPQMSPMACARPVKA